MNDVINPMESVSQQPLKGGFSNDSIMAASDICGSEDQRDYATNPANGQAIV